MTALAAPWLPILLSAVIVFAVSSLIHMMPRPSGLEEMCRPAFTVKMKGAWTVAVLVLAVPAPSAAQVSVGAGVFDLTFHGDDFTGLHGAIGVEGRFLFRIGPSTDFGLGIQFSSHRSDFAPPDIGVLGVVADIRSSFHIRSTSATPFATIRFGWTQRGLKAVDTNGDGVADETLHQGGAMVGIGPGVLVPLSSTMMVDVSALLNVMSYVDVTFQGNTIGGTGATGYALQVCAGFTYRPGRH